MKTLLFYLFFIFGIAACSYLPDEVDTDPLLEITESADYILLTPKDQIFDTKSGIIFYPGGLVDPHAYVQMLSPLATDLHRHVVIVKVESNLAVYSPKKASKIISEFPQVHGWVLGGHSLGGAMACTNIEKKGSDFAGLFLLAAYPNKDISGIEIPVISITASEDKVLTWDKWESSKKYLPEALDITSPADIPTDGSRGFTLYYQIVGGVHGQFGSYGTQKGDGSPSITATQQHALVIEALNYFLNRNDL